MANKQVAPCTDPTAIGDTELINELFSRFNCVVFLGLKDSRGTTSNQREDRIMRWKCRTMFEALGLIDYSSARMQSLLAESESEESG